MFTISNDRFNTKVPIRIWLEDETQIEESCLEQAVHLAKLPFVHRWISLMPDTHTGKGMPIGGVIVHGCETGTGAGNYDRERVFDTASCGRYFKEYTCGDEKEPP